MFNYNHYYLTDKIGLGNFNRYLVYEAIAGLPIQLVCDVIDVTKRLF